MVEESVVISRTEKPHSFEFGKAGNRIKIFYDTPEELNTHVKKLKEIKIIKDEE